MHGNKACSARERKIQGKNAIAVAAAEVVGCAVRTARKIVV
jgi:hypothetical protein